MTPGAASAEITDLPTLSTEKENRPMSEHECEFYPTRVAGVYVMQCACGAREVSR